MPIYDLSTKDIKQEIIGDNRQQAFIKFFQFIDDHDLWEKIGGIVILKERGADDESYPMRTHTVAYLKGRLTKDEAIIGITKLISADITDNEFYRMCDTDKWVLK